MEPPVVTIAIQVSRENSAMTLFNVCVNLMELVISTFTEVATLSGVTPWRHSPFGGYGSLLRLG